MLNFHKLNRDYLLFTGSDRLDLINRLSTNLVNGVPKYGTVKTILTSDKGRIIDLLEMFVIEDKVFVSCSFNNSQNVISHLDKYTIMDDFTAVNLSGSHYAVLFTGSDTGNYIFDAAGIDTKSITSGAFSVTSDNDAIVYANDDAMGGYKFICSAEDKDYWERKLFSDEMKAKYGLSEMTGNEFEINRISLGIPAFGKEMSEQFNPLECGLGKYVSFTKGCYIGQEVIARLDAYDKISRHMVKLTAQADIGSGIDNIKITTEGKECGIVTSFINNGGLNFIALGFIKTIFLSEDKKYKLKYNNSELEAEIEKL